MGLVVFAAWKLVVVFGGNVRGDAAEESDQARLACVAQIFIRVEDVFEAFQERIVIERRVGNRAGLQEGRK